MTNVFCILISVLKYKIHDKSISNTKYKILFPNVFQIKYKIHAKYFKYVFQIHVFQILPNTGVRYVDTSPPAEEKVVPYRKTV